MRLMRIAKWVLTTGKSGEAITVQEIGRWERFRSDRWLQVEVAVYACIWGVLSFNPTSRSDWLVENLLVFAAVPVLAYSYKGFQFSRTSYTLILAFLLFHAYGAHYTYSETPIGNSLRDTLALTRNHYDRFVHFLFGLLLCRPVQEFLLFLRCPVSVAKWIAPLLLLAGSAVYEFIEWIAAALSAPELGAMFLGSQGDIWDAQKDMALGWAGALLWSLFALIAVKLKVFRMAIEGGKKG